ncbi:MAG TPA: hypothetical protein VLS49_06245 [Usitatibacter sp.]|nr:hypothetical protein [Usitatibacter sp.]
MERRLGIMAFALAAWLASTSTGTSAADAAACEEARARAAALRADLDRSIGPKARPFFAGAGRSAATWEAYAGEAYALGGFRAALWGELNALDREWRPRSVSRAGVYLEKLGRAPEASRFLKCARALGYRSPYLLEALASARLRSGDKMGATTAIREAQQMAPGDVLIDAERSIIETGRPPQPPRKDDALGQALRDLERHVAAVKAAMRHRQELQKRIDATLGIRNDSGPFPPEAERQVDRQMDEVRYWVDQVRLPLDEVTRRHPDRPAQRVQAERAAARYAAPPQLIDAYFRATERLLGYEWGLGPTGQHELLLWADVLDLDPLAYAREIHDAAHVDGTDALAHYRGTQARLASLQGPALLAVSHPSDAAKAKLDEGMVRCGHQYPAGSQSSQLKACELAEQSAYCTTMRALYDRWTKAAQARYAIAGRQFDRVATRREAWAAQQLADALAFARRVMKGFKRGDPAARAVAGAMNRDYRRLAEIALGNGSAGPAAVIRESAGWYRRDRADAEADQASAAASLAEMCAPVERRVLEALAEQHSKEVLDMLRARFLRDFNVAYEDAAHCEF